MDFRWDSNTSASQRFPSGRARIFPFPAALTSRSDPPRQLPLRVACAKSVRMDKPVAHPEPPAAEQRPYSYERHGVTIEDPWHWIRDQKYPQVEDKDVLAYLKAENDYFEHWAGQHRELLDKLFEEMKGRIKEDESS